MDNQHIQQHIQTVREGLEKATPGPWQYQHGGHYGNNHLVYEVSTDNLICMAKTHEKTEESLILIANSPTWLQQSIDMLEQQQREIGRLRAALIEERDYSLHWNDVIVNRINAVLCFNKDLSPPIDYKARYEALVQGVYEFPGLTNSTANDLITWLESVCPHFDDAHEAYKKLMLEESE